MDFLANIYAQDMAAIEGLLAFTVKLIKQVFKRNKMKGTQNV